MKKLNLDQSSQSTETEESTRTTGNPVKAPSDIMSFDNFFVELKKVNPSAAILSTVLEHNDSFVPKRNDIPVCLSSLYNSKYFDLFYHELLTECIKVYDSISVTHQQATSLEKITQKKSNSKV